MLSSPIAEHPIEHSGDKPVSRHVRRAEHLSVVVGFDGSEGAYRALDAAALLIADRAGILEVVFVVHLATVPDLAVDPMSESLKAFDEAALEFADAVRDRLAGIEGRWHFQRRDGAVAHELMMVADELHRVHGSDSQVVMVVGSAMHSVHRFVGSVPVALVRNRKYPVVVVP